MEVVIVPHSQQTQFSLASREWPVYILEWGRSSCKGDASYLPLWFRAFTPQVSTPGFWLQGEDLRQIVMRSPCSFCLGEKQFIRQYCKIFFSKKHPRKLNKPLLSSRSKKCLLIFLLKCWWNHFILERWSSWRICTPSNYPDEDGECSGKLIQAWEDGGDLFLLGIW